MAEKKNADKVEVVKCQVALIKYGDGSGRFHQPLYFGSQVPSDVLDQDHLKLLRDEGLIGPADEGDAPLGAAPEGAFDPDSK